MVYQNSLNTTGQQPIGIPFKFQPIYLSNRHHHCFYYIRSLDGQKFNPNNPYTFQIENGTRRTINWHRSL